MNTPKPLTPRAAAAAAGAKTYVTGKPCKNGHYAARATLTGTCVQCTAEASKRWLAARPGKSAEYTAAYRERNTEAVREADRQAKARARAERPDEIRDIRSRSYKKRVLETEGRVVREFNLLPEAELLRRLEEVHGAVLQYAGGYVNMLAKADFLCTVHNEVIPALPHNVLRGATPCPRCNHTKSKGEEAVYRLLSTYYPSTQWRAQKMLGDKRELDVYLPDQKLAVEYCGEHWHSHDSKEAERERKHRHFQKYVDCKALGIRLITLYESEWLEHNYAVRRLLRNAVGKSKGKLMARKCELRKVTTAEARGFYDRYHPQGGNGYGEHYALFWKGKMVACMRFVLGANDRGAGAANRVWTLGRYATRITVAGAASRLFKAFVEEHNPPVVKSFSDNRFFEGGMYAQLGFVLEEEVAPDYQVWHQKLGLLPKSHFQRRAIPARIRELGASMEFDPETDPRTEAEITYALKARRIYDCGKKRWVWTPKA